MAATIEQLAQELVDRIQLTPDFKDAGFYVYNILELTTQSDTVGFPFSRGGVRRGGGDRLYQEPPHV